MPGIQFMEGNNRKNALLLYEIYQFKSFLLKQDKRI